jgi:low temperature requirement protein LtrA
MPDPPTSRSRQPHSGERGRSLAAVWRAHLTDRVARGRCIRIALVVGTILVLVNQGDALVHGQLSALLAVKLALDYLVPFVVSSTGFVAARRQR